MELPVRLSITKSWRIVALAILSIWVLPCHLNGVVQDTPQTPCGPVEVVIISPAESWLVATAAPIVRQVRAADELPYLLVCSGDCWPRTRQILNRITPQKCLILTTDGQANEAIQEGFEARTLQVDNDPTIAALRLAEAFWEMTDRIVLAHLHDTEAVLLGSALAAHLEIPFVALEREHNRKALETALEALKVRQVLMAVVTHRGSHPWSQSLAVEVETIDRERLEHDLVESICRKNIKNVILTRTPTDVWPSVGQTSWLAPYLSVLHGSPIILSDSSDAELAEGDVEEFLEKYGLQPRTVTILADYDSIGPMRVMDNKLGVYEVFVEPCSKPENEEAAAFGVGRIPFAGIPECSALISLSLARKRQESQEVGTALILANSGANRSLLLAETVSRATAAEFKNVGFDVEEFYGVSAYAQSVRQAASTADIIVYEGHLADQSLFHDPWGPVPSFYLADYEPEAPPYVEDDDQGLSLHPMTTTIYAHGNPHYNLAVIRSQGDYVDQEDPMDLYTEVYPEDYPPHGPGSPNIQSEPIEYLEGLPVVILQSCNSLDLDIARRILNLGGVAVIGSVTNVHSASGSTFVKAFCDGLLYRGLTLGEALRDARNYYLCLAELKTQRDHSETPKVYRVALSFCLWGDPELRLSGEGLPKPKRRPVSLHLADPSRPMIKTPKKRLPKIQTSQYQIRIFAGSQLAGIVKRLKGKEYRRIAPMYFFRVPIPTHWQARGFSELVVGDGAPDRTVFLTDPYKASVYVLHFPEQQEEDERIKLHFVE